MEMVRFLLNPISIEYDFGLRTALNLVDDKNISTAGLFTPSEIAMRTLKQAGKHTGINQYDINIYNSLLKNISGKVKKEYANYFKMIDGADTIRFSFSKPKEELFSIINELYNIYQKDSYKRTDLYWIDNFKLVRNRELIAKLDLKLVEAVKNSSDDVVLMFPEFLSSADYCAYSYSGINKISNTSVIFSALDIKDQIYDKIENKDEISIAKMKEWQINRIVYSNLETIRHYSIYQCLYYEQNENDKFYFIESGNWYSIEKEFSDIIEENYKRLFSNKMEFEFSYKNVGLDTKARADDVDNEYLFNLDLSNYLNNFGVAERLDRKMINYKKSTIELCDVLYKCDNSLFFIHNKYRHGSSSLSHLFSQGSVSAEAIVDKKFREAANKEIINDILKLPLDDKIKRDDIYIIYGIIAKKNSRNVFVLPIFSKINLMLFSEHIEKLGYNIRLSFFIQE